MKDIAEAAPFLGKFASMYGVNPASPQPTGMEAAFLPYWNVFDEQVTYIPTHMLTSSNGMCAGNTPEEALVEGICEVFERYVLSRIFFENASVPTIPMSYIKNFKVHRLITDIQKRGYYVLVKDLSLEGKYPVLGVILFNKDRTKYSVRLGSSPIFETALQRCLTEVSQNYSFSDFEYKMMDFRFDFCEQLQYQRDETDNIQLLLHYTFNNLASAGHYPADLLLEEAPADSSFKQAFKENFESNKNSLRFVLDLIKRQGKSLYIRDVSYLSFPAYHVYISDLSCVDPIWFSRDVEGYHTFNLRAPARNLLLRLRSLHDNELRVLADCMKKDIESQFPFAFNVFSAMRFLPRLLLKEPNSLPFRIDQIPYAVWLVVILYRLKDYEQALYYLCFVLDRELYEKENYGGFDLDGIRSVKKRMTVLTPLPDPARYLYQPMFFLLKKLSLGIAENEAEVLTAEYFGKELAGEVFDFLDLKSPGLPDCGDCSGCSLREECNFDIWKHRATAINEQMSRNFPKQSNLKEIFSD